MKHRTVFTKADIIVTLGCVIFLLGTIGAVGPGGQRHAKEMLCLSQLHKWGTFFQSYLNDNGGYFPKGWSQENYMDPEIYWMEALRPYYKKHQMRVCPEATVPGSELGLGEYGNGGGSFSAWGVFTSAWQPVVPGDYGSYGMNGWACNPPPDYYQSHPTNNNWRVANVAGGDNIPLFLDSQWVDGWPDDTDEPPYYDGQPWNTASQMGRCCINRHGGYINSAFLDFSARKVGLKELWTLKWHREYDTCSVWTVCGGVTPGDWPDWMEEFEDY